MEIGKIKIDKPVILAPMAGVTDKAFRILARKQGAGLVYTEMVSAQALTYKNLKTLALIDLKNEKPPLAIQIFGSEPKVMAEAAKIVESYGADIVDLNMGCPVNKIVKNNEGSALMQNPKLAMDIVAKVVKAVSIPVTVKFRKGWDEKSITAVEFANGMEASGASALTIHGRTKTQMYSGQADWEIIRMVKDAVRIPVIGNGDIFSPQDAVRMFQSTGCDGIMIGRGAMGDPWIFKRINAFLKTGVLLPKPSFIEVREMILKQIELSLEYNPEIIAIKEMRKHIAWYMKGLPHACRIRREVNQISTLEQLREIFEQ